MFHESWSAILFRLVNFGVLLWLAHYLYKRYFKIRLDDKITSKEALLKGLEEQGYFLEGRAQDLEMRLKEQELTGDMLKQKMQDWNNAVIQEHYKRQEEQRLCAAYVAVRTQKKNELLHQHVLQQEVLPGALAHAQAELKKTFASSSSSKQFVHDIIQRLPGS